MRKLILFTLCLFGTVSLFAQQRYVEEIFNDVSVESNQIYASNFDVLLQSVIPLTVDVYQPIGDTEDERPVVMIAHTGSFFPRIFNGAPTGAKDDSVVVEVATLLAKRGYVACAYTYRQGWQPQSPVDDIRKASILQAAYRGIQDTRSLARYLRRTVVEQSNPYGIDPDKIAAWGIGTGGYLSYGAAVLDDWEEVILDKFRDGNFVPYVDSLLLGNMLGTSFGIDGGDTLNYPNNVGFDSDIQMAINMGGALGDASWIDGDNSSIEPPMIGFHCPTDAFAPYYRGNVVVPNVGIIVIDDASGTREAIGLANDLGLNDDINGIPSVNDPIGTIIQGFKSVSVTIDGQTIDLGTDNFYPFTGLTPGAGSPWDWWSLPVLEARVDFINQNFGQNFDAQQIHDDALLTNPTMSSDQARRYIDTIMMVAAPRMCLGLGLDCGFTAVDEIDASQVSATLAPNPVQNIAYLTSAADAPMKEVRLFDVAGRLIRSENGLNTSAYEMRVGDLATGNYYIAVRFEEGIVVHQMTKQ